MSPTVRTSALAAAALLTLAGAAQAQGYAPYGAEPYGEAEESYGPPGALYDVGTGNYDHAPVVTPLVDGSSVDGIVVRSPRQVGRSSSTGAPIELVNYTRTVSYADLDLRTPWGARQLQQRVNRAARQACQRIGMVNVVIDDDAACTRDAVSYANDQVVEAIFTARQGW